MAAHVFHVEFGLNETALTRALESKQYDLAEKLIRDATSPSYLDEGFYQRTPLYIVLCGRAETFLSYPRNFFLAKLLIERGGDVNLRIPETYPGAEFMNPGKSPLELVTDFYNGLTRHEEICCQHVPWVPKRDVVIGFDKQRITAIDELLQQVIDLTLIMLECGGDVNVRGVSGATLLHRTVVGSTDERLLYLLCDNGADYNAIDRSGMTPLTAACSQLSRVQIMKCDHRDIVQRQVPYLLSLDNIQVNTQDQHGRTALFYRMLWPDTQCALMLLRQPCDPCLKASVLLDTGARGSFSPLFACLGVAAVKAEYKRVYLALLLDSGYFTKPAIAAELWEAVEDITRWRHLKAVGPQLVCDMFGVTSTTLKQLCTRVVLRHVTRCQGETTELSTTHSEQRSNIDDLTSHGLTALVKTLDLPETSMQCFETELLAAQLCKTLKSHDWFPQKSIDDPSSDSDESDSEYW